MTLTSSRFLIAAALVSLFSACGPSWKVIRAGPAPSPLHGATDVAVAFDYNSMMIEGHPTAEWVALKVAEDAKYTATWADLMGKFEAAVIEGMRSRFPSAHPVQAGASPVTVVVTPHRFQMGKLIPFVLPPTIMDVNLVWQFNGQVTDEIAVTHSYPVSLVQPSVFNHIGPVGSQVGSHAARFLSSR
jgi:hypothetical protein